MIIQYLQLVKHILLLCGALSMVMGTGQALAFDNKQVTFSAYLNPSDRGSNRERNNTAITISQSLATNQVIASKAIGKRQLLALGVPPNNGGDGDNGNDQDNGDNGNDQNNGDNSNNGGNSNSGYSFTIKTYKDQSCQQNAGKNDKIQCLKLE